MVLTGGRNLLWHLPNLFNSSLGAHEPFSIDCFFVSFFVTGDCCLFPVVSLYIMVLLVSNSMDSLFATSLSYTAFTKMIFLLSSTLDLLVSPSYPIPTFIWGDLWALRILSKWPKLFIWEIFIVNSIWTFSNFFLRLTTSSSSFSRSWFFSFISLFRISSIFLDPYS